MLVRRELKHGYNCKVIVLNEKQNKKNPATQEHRINGGAKQTLAEPTEEKTTAEEKTTVVLETPNGGGSR